MCVREGVCVGRGCVCREGMCVGRVCVCCGKFYSTSWTLQQTYSDVVGVDVVRVGPSKL